MRPIIACSLFLNNPLQDCVLTEPHTHVLSFSISFSSCSTNNNRHIPPPRLESLSTPSIQNHIWVSSRYFISKDERRDKKILNFSFKIPASGSRSETTPKVHDVGPSSGYHPPTHNFLSNLANKLDK